LKQIALAEAKRTASGSDSPNQTTRFERTETLPSPQPRARLPPPRLPASSPPRLLASSPPASTRTVRLRGVTVTGPCLGDRLHPF